jgi:hypothetical protein
MQISIITLSLIFSILGISPVEAGELPAREPLDALWKQHMLEGDAHTSVHIEINGGIFHKSERAAKEPSGSWKGGRWNMFFNESRNITVAQYGEGFWGKGGWVLEGGLVGRAKEGSSTIELYGKAVEHKLPYIQFLIDRNIPHESGGYEFYLLQREGSCPRATIVRKWTIPPHEVVLKPQSVGPPEEDVRATLEYDDTAKRATIGITGLTRPFKESVAISEREGTKPEQLETR